MTAAPRGAVLPGVLSFCLDEEFVTVSLAADWVPAGGLEKVLQALHEQAHPDGAAYRENCLEPACADAWRLLNADDA